MIMIQLTNTPLQPISGFASGITANPADLDVPTRFAAIISNIITIITFFSGLAFLVWFIIGALTWISSADQADKLTKAKNQMSSAIVGLIIVILSIPITYVIGKILGFDILSSSDIITKLAPQ